MRKWVGNIINLHQCRTAISRQLQGDIFFLSENSYMKEVSRLLSISSTAVSIVITEQKQKKPILDIPVPDL